MTTIDFVDVAAARDAPGVRIVVSGLVPSPWSEAAKGLFRIANVPVLAVRRGRDAAEITAWTGVDNVYLATFLTPLSDITPEDCPQLAPNLRQAFGCAHEAFGSLVPAELVAHRKLVFDRHLGWPIAL